MSDEYQQALTTEPAQPEAKHTGGTLTDEARAALRAATLRNLRRLA